MKKSIQDTLLEIVLSNFEKRSQAVDVLSEKLNIGKDAVYRRLRGDTILTPEEIALLARDYNISLDALVFEDTDTLFFKYSPFIKPINEFRDFLLPIQQGFEEIQKLPDTHIYYTYCEIPFFLYCFFPELISFKLYVWGRTVWDFDYLTETQFDFEVIPYSIIQITEELLASYKSIPSTELWSLNIVDNTLNQIEYFVNSGKFKDDNDALSLCDKLLALIEHMRAMALHGTKFLINGSPEDGGAYFNLYHNEMVYTNNTIFVNNPVRPMVYTTFSNPNFLISTDRKVCEYMDNWFTRLIAKSNPISTHSEKNRDWFFNALKRKINISRKRIELHALEDEF